MLEASKRKNVLEMVEKTINVENNEKLSQLSKLVSFLDWFLTLAL